MDSRFENALRQALTPSEEASTWLNQKIVNQMEEHGTMIEKKKYQELIDIMWAFDQNTIDKIAKKAAKDKKYEEISKMACFVSKDVLGEIAKKMTKEREYKALEEIACFIA